MVVTFKETRENLKKTMVLCVKVLAIVGVRNPDQKDQKEVK